MSASGIWKAAVPAVAVVLAGCSLGEETLTPKQAAQNAFDVHDADKRRRAVHRLASAEFGGKKPYLRVYRLLADDPDPTVRAACMKALGRHGGPEDADLLVKGLRDDNAFVRWEAAKALERIHAPRAIDPLLKALRSDNDADVRAAAARALGQYPRPAVFDGLVGALSDRSFTVAQAAGRSLRTITGHEGPGLDPAAWMAWREKRDTPFARAEGYRYRPYAPPRNFLERMWFWGEPEPPQARAPRGAQASGEKS